MERKDENGGAEKLLWEALKPKNWYFLGIFPKPVIPPLSRYIYE